MRNQKGFSLLELMIVVAIIGILTAIAYPSYQEHIIKTRKSDSIAMINKVMTAQERFFANNLTYTTDLRLLGFADQNNLPSAERHYLVSAVACGNGINECVSITTVAQGVQVTDTPADDNLGLTSQGVKAGKWP